MKNEISDRQKEMIEVSGKILLEKGIKGLTTKALAAEMNFSESAIYRHFKNKEDIIVLLLNVLVDDFRTRLPLVIKESQTATENLRAVFDSQFAFFQQNPHFTVAILSEGLIDESEEIMQAMIKIPQVKTFFLMQIIEQGKANNEFRTDIPSEVLIEIIAGTFRLQMLKWKFSRFQLDLKKEGNKMIDYVLKLISV